MPLSDEGSLFTSHKSSNKYKVPSEKRLLADVSYLSMATDAQRYQTLRAQFDAKVYVE